MENTQVKISLIKLKNFIESQHFKGYDPYDALNSWIPFSKFGKWAPIIAIQLHKRNPINLRALLGIHKGINPKSMGLLLEAYSQLYKTKPSKELQQQLEFFFNWVCENYSKGYSGYCWGYNFDWASSEKYLKAYTPSIVVSAFVAKGVFEYYQCLKDPKAVDVLKSICDFLLNDLPITEDDGGICFSYTPIKKDCCYNATMLGAEVLSKVFSITGDDKLAEYAKKTVDFTLAHQNENGCWNYSIDLNTGIERKQIDFHQGFILDSLHDYIYYSKETSPKYKKALLRGAEFYIHEQFSKNGRSKWRLPKEWPIEIHNQAQGIISFSKMKDLNKHYFSFANTIANWTIENMQDRNGYFHYQQHRLFSIKIPYMRWAQAWMLLALSHLVEPINEII